MQCLYLGLKYVELLEVMEMVGWCEMVKEIWLRRNALK